VSRTQGLMKARRSRWRAAGQCIGSLVPHTRNRFAQIDGAETGGWAHTGSAETSQCCSWDSTSVKPQRLIPGDDRSPSKHMSARLPSRCRSFNLKAADEVSGYQSLRVRLRQATHDEPGATEPPGSMQIMRKAQRQAGHPDKALYELGVISGLAYKSSKGKIRRTHYRHDRKPKGHRESERR